MGPLVLPFLSFAAGIALGDLFSLGYAYVVPALFFSSALILGLRFFKATFTSLALVPLFFSLGALFVIPVSNPEVPRGHIVKSVTREPFSGRMGSIVEGTVDSAESTGRRTRIWLDAERLIDREAARPVSGMVLVTVNGRVELLPGDRVRALAQFDVPRTFGNPGEFDYGRWLARRGVLVTAYVKDARLIEKVGAAGGPAAMLQGARAAVARMIDTSGAAYPEPLKALVVSGQGGVDRALREAFAATGTSHILSISGLHIGIVAAFSYWLIMALMRRSERALIYLNARKAALVLSVVPAVAYAALAGLPVPTQRALVMVIAFMASFVLGRGKDHLNTLSLAGLIVLAVFPGSLWDASFQLSFAAMASIIILVPRLNRLADAALGTPVPAASAHGGVPGNERLDGKGSWQGAVRRQAKDKALPLLIVTIAAGAGTSPLLAWHFHRVSVAGLAANLVAVPIAGAIVPILLASSALMAVWEPLAWALIFPADLAFGLLARVVEAFASIPYASVWVTPPKPYEIALYYLLVLSLVSLGRSRLFRYSALACAVLLGAPMALGQKADTGVLRATFLSVGQGDSAFVELPAGKTMLIDGGGSNNPDFDTGERVVAPFLRTKGVDRIDYMVLSHAQQDHMGGLAFIADNFEVGEFWWNGEGSLGRLGQALERKGVIKRVVNASTGRIDAGGAAVEFFNPTGRPLPDENDNSLVMRVGYGQRGVLFTGDIGEKAEARLKGDALWSDVMKAPHHGSRHSSTAGFIAEVSPSMVVVSSGRKNSYGFPHAETLSRYADAGAEVMRTDTAGAVIVETDGQYLRRRGHLTGEGR